METDPRKGAVLQVTEFRPPAGRPGRTCMPVSLRLHAGDSILLTGPSGIGKTSMLRAIVGFVEPGSGTCAVASNVRMAIVPQKPYLPVGTLRDLVCFPRVDRSLDETLADALVRCGLGALSAQLDAEQPWDRSLSMGERQRLAFANLLLRDLDLIILDEATSALDEISQARLMKELRRAKPACAILSIGHRPSLVPLHDRVVTLAPEEASGSPAVAQSLDSIEEQLEEQVGVYSTSTNSGIEAIVKILRLCSLHTEDAVLMKIEKIL